MGKELRTFGEVTISIEDLKELVNRRFEDLKESTGRELTSVTEARVKAESDMNSRLGTMNEWRGSLEDQSAKFMTKDESRATIKALEDKLTVQESRINALTMAQVKNTGSSEGAKNLWVLLVGALLALIGVASLVVNIMKATPSVPLVRPIYQAETLE